MGEMSPRLKPGNQSAQPTGKYTEFQRFYTERPHMILDYLQALAPKYAHNTHKP